MFQPRKPAISYLLQVGPYSGENDGVPKGEDEH